jgi:hypothetical protein
LTGHGTSSLTIDVTAPTTPAAAPTSYNDNVGTLTNATSTAVVTDDATPGLNIGAVPAGTTPSLYVDGVKVDATYDPVTGTLTPVTPLLNGTHALKYTLTDAAQNESGLSPALTLTVDTVAPGAPVITAVTDDVAPALGNVTNGGSTNDTKPTFTGTAEAGSTVTLYEGATVLGTATADSNGNWSITPATALTESTHSITAKATDAAGTTGAASAAYAVTVDTSAPAAPSRCPCIDLVELTRSAPRSSPQTVRRASHSTPSPTRVAVPWALQ